LGSLTDDNLSHNKYYELMNQNITIKDSWVYQGPFMKNNIFKMHFLEADLKHSEIENKDTDINLTRPGKASRFQIVLARDIETEHRKFCTKTIYAMLGTLGGFFALFGRMIGYIMTYFNGFNLDNSMTKRLYSVHDEDYEPKKGTIVNDEGNTDEQKNAKISDKMFNDIKSRKSF